jgi:hypothetical protein
VDEWESCVYVVVFIATIIIIGHNHVFMAAPGTDLSIKPDETKRRR